MLTSQHRFKTYQSMRTDLWGSRKDIWIVCFLLSNFEQRSLNAAVSFVWTGDIFENTLRVDADIFYTDKGRCVFKNIRISVDEALVNVNIGQLLPLTMGSWTLLL